VKCVANAEFRDLAPDPPPAPPERRRFLFGQRNPVFVEFADNYTIANNVADETSADLVLVPPKFEASV